LQTWDPHGKDGEIVLFLEDDLTVSKHFYRYLKLVHSKYGNTSEISGFTLQGSTVLHDTSVNGILDVDIKHKVFLYPTLGTSGFSPVNRHWELFQGTLLTLTNVDIGTYLPHVYFKHYPNYNDLTMESL